MASGYNPAKRSRNIGTSKQGHGQNNRLTVPNSKDQFFYYEKIGNHRRENLLVSGKSVTFLIEEPRKDWAHPCSVSDVENVLRSAPASDWAGINTIFFRCPTRKQAILNPVWGRLLYYGEISTAKGQIVAYGPMILLEAVKPNSSLHWPATRSLESQKEFHRLQIDGHRFTKSGNRFVSSLSLSASRNTQLYRTLLHEIGHWFDWLEKVQSPLARGVDMELAREQYFARPTNEREAFAHRYADELNKRLMAKGVIPF